MIPTNPSPEKSCRSAPDALNKIFIKKNSIKKSASHFFQRWKKSASIKKSKKKRQKKARGGVRVLHQPLKSTNFGFFRVFLRTLSGNLGQKSRAPPTPSIVFERCFSFRGGGIFPQGALSGAPGGVGGLGFYPSKRGAARGFLTIFRAGTMASGEHLDDRPSKRGGPSSLELTLFWLFFFEFFGPPILGTFGGGPRGSKMRKKNKKK